MNNLYYNSDCIHVYIYTAAADGNIVFGHVSRICSNASCWLLLQQYAFKIYLQA